MTTTALEGCRVIEIGRTAAAIAGRMLAGLGAEVIKIEPPGGDPSRHAREMTGLGVNQQRLSYEWLAFNVGKRSVVIDLNSLAGRDNFQELAGSASIVLTDFQAIDIALNDTLQSLGRAVNSGLVWTEIWPYGREEPHCFYPAGDIVLQAMGGHLYLNGDADRPPVRVGAPVALLQGGAEAASAALMAYYHAVRTGEGQRVDISIQECVTWTLLNTTMTVQLLPMEEMRGGAVKKERANKFFTRLVWTTRDGYIHFTPVGGGGGVARAKSYDALVSWMREEGFFDPILINKDWNGQDMFDITQSDYNAVEEVIANFIRTKTSAELMERAVRERILLAPVSSIPDVLNNPQFRARNLYQAVQDHDRGTAFEYPVRWARLSKTPLVSPKPAPQPDADGAAIRAGLHTGEEVKS